MTVDQDGTPTIESQQEQQQSPPQQQPDMDNRVHQAAARYFRRENLEKLKIPIAVMLVAIVASGNTQVFVMRCLYPIYWLCLRMIAVALGVALGLGFATHVYDQLELWTAQSKRAQNGLDFEQLQQQRRASRKEETQALLMEHLRGPSTTGYDGTAQQQANIIKSGRHLTKAAPSTAPGTATKLFHESGYAALMASAGYDIDPDYKRGSVVKAPKDPAYPFTDAPLDQQYALTVMTEEYPALPPPIIKEIARFMELLMRDYVSTWYSMVDAGMPYPDYPAIVQNAKNKKEPGDPKAVPTAPTKKPHPFTRWMVFSNERSRQKPLVEHVYRSVTIILGNLAHRTQDVNIFRLVLLKWIKVIAHTFKAYRQLRKAILEKQAAKATASSNTNKGIFEDARGSVGRAVRRTVHAVKSTTGAGISSSDLASIEESIGGIVEESNNAASAASSNNGETRRTPGEPATYEPVSEMAIAREFLFTGKLHPAVTFGLEIPSLLFSDPKGKDCGTGVESNSNNTETENGDHKTDDQILEERLFQTPILAECELDYNRVLASRIVKLLIPRQDYGSPIVASLLTEILGGCVLAPTMSCFCPDYLNDWIIMLIDMMVGGGGTAKEAEEDEKSEQKEATIQRASSAASDASTPVTPDGQPILRTWGEDEEPSEEVRNVAGNSGFLEDIYGDQAEGEEMGDLMDLSSKQVLDYSELHKEAAEELLGTGRDVRPPGNDGIDAPDSAADSADDLDEEDVEEEDIIMEETTNATGAYQMISILADALMNVQRHLDLDEVHQSSHGEGAVEVDWDSPSCKNAVLRLVLVVEALILHGRRKTPIQIEMRHGDGDKNEGGETLQEEFNSSSFTQIMMDLTSDIEAFEKLHVVPEDLLQATTDDDESEESSDDADLDDCYVPSPSDLSTLRTLIAAWLHTGQIFRTVSTLAKAKTTVLRPFYHSSAFLRNPYTSSAFTRQLRPLDGVDVMADTVAILNSPRIDPTEAVPFTNNQDETSKLPATSATKNKTIEIEGTPRKLGFKSLIDKGMQNLNDKKKAIGDKVNLKASLRGKTRSLSSEKPPPGSGTVPEATPQKQPQSTRELSSSSVTPSVAPSMTTYSQLQQQLPGGTPRYLDYHRNEAFASSLRSERERRMESWIMSIQDDTEMIQVVSRIKGATPEDAAYHRELHHVARIFYAGTNLIGIRDAARSKQRERLNTADSAQSIASGGSDTQSPEVSLLTVEMACSRRKIEVPDDDSSFLLRAQPRPLNSMGVHRDTRNADQSYRGFAASFEEPTVFPGSNKYSGGRYIRRCQLRYYPSNRMASVVLLHENRRLDQRKGRPHAPENIRGSPTPGSVPFLSPEFMRERHLCQKWMPKGSTSRSQPGLMASNVMEQADFTAVPRTGKALDFVYRMSLFESPMIDLGGKRFTVHDAASQGAHRADASALEISDAALSAALLITGRDYSLNAGTDHQADEVSVASSGHVRNKVELGPDGYPIIWMKYSRKMQDGTTSTEIKPYRVSFIRASLLITSTRQEAQLQCLIKCVKAGSAKSATKARTDAQLRPTLRLLDFARDRSREKQEKLLRDLKLGMNHIDREQLRRNALLNPRYPTEIQSIQVSIEKALPAKDANVRIPGNPQCTVFKIRCVATIGLVSEEIPGEILEPYLTQERKPALTYKETWVVYRPFRDFQTLHKHLKSQVAASESSGTAGSRLVGAAAAAFTAGVVAQGNRSRQRNALIPSLGQAQKAGALGVTQRSITKRMEVLDGYLHHLLANSNQLRRSPEVLLFIGAFYPLSRDVLVGKLPISPLNDPLGRAEMSREVLKLAPAPRLSVQSSAAVPNHDLGNADSGQDSGGAEIRRSARHEPVLDAGEEANKDSKAEKLVMTNPLIVSKIEKVPLGKVRNRIFELLSYQFGFENASFFRSRMLSALKTMSFAVTTPGDFQKTLYKVHCEQASADALAYWINYGIDMLWPDGIFYESSPPLTPEQQMKLSDTCKALLHSSFPEQLRTVLGQDLTRDGLDMLHEMLQNRLVMKSMFYMLFDLLWEEIFPEMKDVLSCGEALDINFDDEE